MNPTAAIALANKVAPLISMRIGSSELIDGAQFKAALALALVEVTRPPEGAVNVRIAVAYDGGAVGTRGHIGESCDERSMADASDDGLRLEPTHRAVIEAWIPAIEVPVVQAEVAP